MGKKSEKEKPNLPMDPDTQRAAMEEGLRTKEANQARQGKKGPGEWGQPTNVRLPEYEGELGLHSAKSGGIGGPFKVIQPKDLSAEEKKELDAMQEMQPEQQTLRDLRRRR